MTYTPLYELLNGSSIANQRVVELFTGDSLNERWRQQDISGTGTFAMVGHGAGGGLSITTGAVAGARSEIDFNNIRQYDPAGCAFSAIVERITDGGANFDLNQTGFVSTDANANNKVVMLNGNNITFIRMATNNAGSSTAVDSTVVDDTVVHKYDVSITATLARGTLDGDMFGVSTTNIPTVKLQPVFMQSNSSSTSASEAIIKYYEAYNI
jgi:hypothetical protein